MDHNESFGMVITKIGLLSAEMFDLTSGGPLWSPEPLLRALWPKGRAGRQLQKPAKNDHPTNPGDDHTKITPRVHSFQKN